MGHDDFDSEASDHSPSRLDPHNLPALIKAQKNYNTGVIRWLCEKVSPFNPLVLSFVPDMLLYIGSVSSDSGRDSTTTEGPYPGQDSAPGLSAMQRYYAMMSSRPAPVPEDHRILPPSQP